MGIFTTRCFPGMCSLWQSHIYSWKKPPEALPWVCPLCGCWGCEPMGVWGAGSMGWGKARVTCSGPGGALRAHSLSFSFVSWAGVTNGFAKHAGSGSDSECSSALGSGLVFEACRWVPQAELFPGTPSVSGLISLILFFDFLVPNPAQTVTYLCVDSKRQKAAEFWSCPLKLQVPKAVLDFECYTALSQSMHILSADAVLENQNLEKLEFKFSVQHSR